MLRKATITDVRLLAEIHFVEFGAHFLPSLGKDFLNLLYLNLIQSQGVYILVEHSDKEVQGFIVGAKDFNSVFKKIIIKNFMHYLLLIVPAIIKNPNLIKKILETFFYPKKMGENIPKAELVIVAVSKKFRRKGLGKSLIAKLEKTFLSNKIKEYKVSMNASNSAAGSFYTSLGFIKKSDFSLYGEKVNLYIKHIT